MTGAPDRTGSTLGWRVSLHARQRAAQMRVDLDQVLDALAGPEVDYPCQAPKYAGQRIAQRGRIAVAYNPVDRVAITVLWNTGEQYTRPPLRRVGGAA